MNNTPDTPEASGFLAQWARAIRPGYVMTEQDGLTLARMAHALDMADKHHRQARHAQAVLAALRKPSEAVLMAALGVGAVWDVVSHTAKTIRVAVLAAEQEIPYA